MRHDQFIRKFLLSLPSFIKAPILRSLVQYPSEVPDTLRFKVAETKEELEQAFALLHDAYVAEKLMTPHPSGLRVTKYHALPSTTTLIAVENNQVVGTLSLVRQSTFGIPLESIFDIQQFPADARLAEVSSLAVRKDQLHQRGRILFPLMKFLYHYAYDYFGVSHLAIAVNPKWIDFYLSLLLFHPLQQKMVENYSFVNGAPAVGASLNLITATEVYFKMYGSKSPQRSLYRFFIQQERRNMEFPLRKKGLISDPILSPELFKHFFIDRTDCLATMNDLELGYLREIYNHSEYLKLLPKPKVINLKSYRKTKRHDAHMEGRLVRTDQSSAPLLIQNVSARGLGGVARPGVFRGEGPFRILVNIEESHPCEIVGEVSWTNDRGSFGFKILQACERWERFNQTIEARLRRQTVPEPLKKLGDI